MKKICVYCGSSPGNKPEYNELAIELGKELARNEIELVYGGGSLGMMGTVARTAMEHGGSVTGVITKQLLDLEVGLTDLSDLRVVNTMHERKAMMADLSDGFIAMPGGFGTMEEIFEALTWAQLEIHEKPCGFLNVCGYYDKLIGFIEHMIDQQFIKDDYRGLVKMDNTPSGLIEKFMMHTPMKVDKAQWALKLAANDA